MIIATCMRGDTFATCEAFWHSIGVQYYTSLLAEEHLAGLPRVRGSRLSRYLNAISGLLPCPAKRLANASASSAAKSRALDIKVIEDGT